MTTSLRRLLEQEAQRTRRSPAPLDDVLSGGASVVRRRRVVGIAIAAAVTLIAVVVPWALVATGADTDQPIDGPQCEMPYLMGSDYFGGPSGLSVASPELSDVSEFLKQYGVGSVAYDPTFSPDGSRVAYEDFVDEMAGATVQSAVTVIDVESRESHRVTGAGQRVSAPTWSPDGSRIAYTSNKYRPIPRGGWGPGALHIVNADGTGRRTIELAAGVDAPSLESWPADDTMLYVEDGAVWRLDPQAPSPVTPERVRTIEGWDEDSDLRLSADGRAVVLSVPGGGEPEHLEIVDLASGRNQSIPDAEVPTWGSLRVLGWTSDDQLLFGRNVKDPDPDIFERFEIWAVSDAGWGESTQLVTADADKMYDQPYEVNPTCSVPE